MEEKLTGKKKLKNDLEYFWMDNKLPVLAVLVVVFLGLYFLFTNMTQKETALSVMLIDCHSNMSGDDMAEDFMKGSGLDGKKYQVQIQSNLLFQGTDSGSYTMTSLSKFMSDIGSEKLDVCAMLEDDFKKYDKSGSYLDLRECLSPEQLEKLKDKLLTASDGRVIGIYADDLPVMKQYGCYENKDTRAAIGIIYNTPHRDEAVKYLLYTAGMRE